MTEGQSVERRVPNGGIHKDRRIVGFAGDDDELGRRLTVEPRVRARRIVVQTVGSTTAKDEGRFVWNPTHDRS